MKRNLLLLATLGVLNVLPDFSVANENDQKIKSDDPRHYFIMHYPGRGVIVSKSYSSNASCGKNARRLQSTFGLKKQWICIKSNQNTGSDENKRYLLYMDMGDEVLEFKFYNSRDCSANGRKIKNYFKPLKLNSLATFKYSCKVTYQD